MHPILALIDVVLEIYKWIVFAAVIISWLYAFNIVNPSNAFVRSIAEAVTRLTEPALRRIRQIVPYMGNVDLSPLVLLVLIWFVQYTIRYIAVRGSLL